MSRAAPFVPEPLAAASMQDARRQLSGLLDDATVAKGFQYALAGRAIILAESRRGLEIEVASICQGGRRDPYTQTVVLSFDASGVLDLVEGDCSCPMEIDCKHVACAALEWLSTRQPPRPPGGKGPAEKGPAEPEPVSIPAEAEEWLRRFASSLARAPETPLKGECVFYTLDPDDLGLEIRKARILKDRRIAAAGGSPDLAWLHAAREAPRYLTRLDIAVYQALARLRDPSGYLSGWNLAGEAGREALDRALDTGRLRCLDAKEWIAYGPRRLELRLDGEGWLKRGPRVAASLDLVAGARGARRWGVRCAQREGLAVLAVSPPAYLDRARGEIGELELDEPDAVAAHLLRMPEIDARGAEVFFSALSELARSHGLESVPRRIPSALVLGREAPQPRVRVTRGVFREYGSGRARDHVRWMAELWFDYPQGPSVPEAARQTTGARWRDADGAERVVLRHARSEAEARRSLSAAGFPPRSTQAFGPGRVDAQRLYMWPRDGSDQAWAEGVQRLFEAAHAAGAVIDCDPAFPHRLREVEEVYEELSAGETPQWFELELGVTVDGARVPIAAALADWIVRTPRPQEWLERAAADAFVPLRAGAAGLIRIPAARLKQLLAPLLDTFGFERDLADGKLRLSRIEAALLAAKAGGARPPADLARLRERLSDFRGVATAAPSASFRATLRPYQQAGLDWLQFLREYGLAGILADDMGLGKTVQALAHLDLEKASGRAKGPSLVVAPTSVLPNWREEAERFAPALRVLTLHGAQRGEQRSKIPGADLVLTSYPLLARDLDSLAAHEYHVLIFDEAQFLKNARTQTRAAAAALRARHRIALTGTPIENNLAELWAHFDLLLPGFLGDAKQFARAWRSPIEREGDAERMGRLARRVRPFILRRTRAEVLDDLPDKTEIVQHVELDGAQRDLYESLRMALDRKLRQAIGAKGIAGSQIVILDALLKLRQACCDPRLVKAPAAKAAHGVSAKLEALREMLGELRAEGKRVLLFSQFTSMLDLIEAELPALGATHVRLDGSTVDRATPVKRFQAGEADVFLISLRAGGTGLNLTAADTVIHYDPWWNPAVEAQATARAHRIGQDKAVFVYKLIALGTVEERIQEMLGRKQALADALLGEGRAGSPLISEEDVRNLLAPID